MISLSWPDNLQPYKKQIMQTCKYILSTLTLLTALTANFPLLAYAQNGNLPDTWYQVQMVIFLNNNLPTKEHWPDNQTAAVPPTGAITLETPTQITADNEASNAQTPGTTSDAANPENSQHSLTPPLGTNAPSYNPLKPNLINHLMVWLPPNDSFTGIISRLEDSGNYPVLYSARWRMPLQAYKTPVTLAIQAAPNASGIDTLTGSITLAKKRFLYVRPDLTYGRPLSAAANTNVTQNNTSLNDDNQESMNTMMQYFPMNLGQKIDVGKLTYIDNPVIGLFIQVTPYTVPQATQTISQQNSSQPSATENIPTDDKSMDNTADTAP